MGVYKRGRGALSGQYEWNMYFYFKSYFQLEINCAHQFSGK